jgi:hypothetical protein
MPSGTASFKMSSLEIWLQQLESAPSHSGLLAAHKEA